MNIEEMKEYCINKPGAYESRPFGENPICYRIAGKIFAQFSPKPDWYKMTLKCNPEQAQIYRSIYPEKVVRGWHCPPVQQPYWNTIELMDFPEDVLKKMIDEAYEETRLKLTKKEQKRLSLRVDKKFKSTDGADKDFLWLCEKLDENLDELVAGKIDRTKYTPFNQSEEIRDVILIYDGDKIIGGGSFRFYDDEHAELKRVWLDVSYRGEGLGAELLRRLEASAKIKGYTYMILESGNLLAEAMKLYRRAGYKVIPNYGPYVNMEESVCMQKKL